MTRAQLIELAKADLPTPVSATGTRPARLTTEVSPIGTYLRQGQWTDVVPVV